MFVKTGLYWRIKSWVQHGVPSILILYGPPGCGKTETMRQVVMEYPGKAFWITATRATNLEALFGHWELRGSETVFVPGELFEALQTRGALIVIDDAHLVAPDLQLLNGLGDSTRRVTVPVLSKTIEIAEGVKLVLIANPPPRTVASWERDQWIIPEQIRDRARVIRVDQGLTPDEELRIAYQVFPRESEALVEHVVELARNLRKNGVLSSFTPSLRSILMLGNLLRQGLSLGEAYLEAIAYKFDDPDEFAVAVEAFKAKFGTDPRDGFRTTLSEGATHEA